MTYNQDILNRKDHNTRYDVFLKSTKSYEGLRPSFLFGFTPHKAEQPIHMELQEKEENKDNKLLEIQES